MLPFEFYHKPKDQYKTTVLLSHLRNYYDFIVGSRILLLDLYIALICVVQPCFDQVQ